MQTLTPVPACLPRGHFISVYFIFYLSTRIVSFKCCLLSAHPGPHVIIVPRVQTLVSLGTVKASILHCLLIAICDRDCDSHLPTITPKHHSINTVCSMGSCITDNPPYWRVTCGVSWIAVIRTDTASLLMSTCHTSAWCCYRGIAQSIEQWTANPSIPVPVWVSWPNCLRKMSPCLSFTFSNHYSQTAFQ